MSRKSSSSDENRKHKKSGKHRDREDSTKYLKKTVKELEDELQRLKEKSRDRHGRRSRSRSHRGDSHRKRDSRSHDRHHRKDKRDTRSRSRHRSRDKEKRLKSPHRHGEVSSKELSVNQPDKRDRTCTPDQVHRDLASGKSSSVRSPKNSTPPPGKQTTNPGQVSERNLKGSSDEVRLSDSSSDSQSVQNGDNNNNDSIQPSGGEDPLFIPVEIPADVLELLGNDLSEDSLMSPKVSEALALRWKAILQGGLKKEVREELIKKYPPIENCSLMQGPKMNPEILASMGETQVKRDSYQERAQVQLGAAIAAAGSVLDKLISDESRESSYIKTLSDSVRIMCDLHHSMSLSRRAFVTPTFDKLVKGLVQNSPVDKLLYGEDFGKRLKTAKAAEKVGINIKVPPPASSSVKDVKAKTGPPSVKNTKPLNWKGPPRKSFYQQRFQGGQKMQQRKPYQPKH